MTTKEMHDILEKVKGNPLRGGDIFWDNTGNSLSGLVMYVAGMRYLVWCNNDTTGIKDNAELHIQTLPSTSSKHHYTYISNLSSALFELEAHYAKIFK